MSKGAILVNKIMLKTESQFKKKKLIEFTLWVKYRIFKEFLSLVLKNVVNKIILLWTYDKNNYFYEYIMCGVKSFTLYKNLNAFKWIRNKRVHSSLSKNLVPIVKFFDTMWNGYT